MRYSLIVGHKAWGAGWRGRALSMSTPITGLTAVHHCFQDLGFMFYVEEYKIWEQGHFIPAILPL